LLNQRSRFRPGAAVDQEVQVLHRDAVQDLPSKIKHMGVRAVGAGNNF
jgi:hypothetical protein